MLPAVYRSVAKRELQEAFHWYEERELGLGSEFIRSIEGTIQLICRHPKIFPIVHHDIRQAVIRRFPYSIFYLVEAKKIVVLAIFHASRDPSIWLQRQSSS